MCRIVGEIASEAVRKHLTKSVSNEIWRHAVQQAEAQALRVFSANLHKILMVPPLSQYSPPDIQSLSICGIDPGQKNGHKIVVLNNQQVVVEQCIVRYMNSEDKLDECVSKMMKLFRHHCPIVVGIGNGTGCLEAMTLAGTCIKRMQAADGTSALGYCVVSEAGASVYSASQTARSEYPETSINFLGAISIAQRVRDPMSELVKISPDALGVGMYQKVIPFFYHYVHFYSQN